MQNADLPFFGQKYAVFSNGRIVYFLSRAQYFIFEVQIVWEAGLGCCLLLGHGTCIIMYTFADTSNWGSTLQLLAKAPHIRKIGYIRYLAQRDLGLLPNLPIKHFKWCCFIKHVIGSRCLANVFRVLWHLVAVGRAIIERPSGSDVSSVSFF